MGKPLDEYRKKRDFDRTPEPAAGRKDRRGPPVFVVHRHDARRLHYDLRIEANGVLCSWAVPRGFSYDPREKRLAVRTEDHPLDYEDFHGVIPEGQYGAGTMTIWDKGSYQLVKYTEWDEAMAKGELKFVFRGRKLRGEWHMVRTKGGKEWLLFKSRDRYSGTDRDTALGVDLSTAQQRGMPRSLKPMTVGGNTEIFSDPQWLFEMKFEGLRVMASKQGESVKLRSVKAKLPEIERDLAGVRAENALFDGALVAVDDNQRPSAKRLQRCLAGESDDPVYYYAFDLLYYEDYDLRSLTLVDRKAALRAVIPPLSRVLFVDHVAGNGESLAEVVARAGLPAMVAKRVDSKYRPGPCPDWQEVRIDSDATELAVGEALSRYQPRGNQGSRVKLTNMDKVYWPAAGFTKGDLVTYYDQVSEYLLPYLRDRPIHMNRFPDGIEGNSFYQRQAKEDLPEWVETVMIDSDSHGGQVRQMICNDRDSLLFLANQGSIDLHPWLSRRGSLASPDWALLDLDPKAAPFQDVVKIARAIGELLRAIGLRPYLKTSGKTGLHIVVPLNAGYTYDQSCTFCEGVARVIAKEHSDIATVERMPSSRGGRVYVDFLQNRRGQTVVPPYSVRPVTDASVSAPLEWDELDSKLHPSLFTIQTLLPRLSQRGDLFRPALEDRQDLLPAIDALGEYLRG